MEENTSTRNYDYLTDNVFYFKIKVILKNYITTMASIEGNILLDSAELSINPGEIEAYINTLGTDLVNILDWDINKIWAIGLSYAVAKLLTKNWIANKSAEWALPLLVSTISYLHPALAFAFIFWEEKASTSLVWLIYKAKKLQDPDDAIKWLEKISNSEYISTAARENIKKIRI